MCNNNNTKCTHLPLIDWQFNLGLHMQNAPTWDALFYTLHLASHSSNQVDFITWEVFVCYYPYCEIEKKIHSPNYRFN